MDVINQQSEKLIGLKVNARYATPSDYFQALESEIKRGTLELPKLIDPQFS